MPRSLLAAAAGLLTLLTASGAPAAPGAGKSQASTGAPSLEILVLGAVAALNDRDTAALARLAAGREDFLAVYPHFAPDTSADRRAFATGYFLEDNRKLLRRAVEQSGGRKLSLARFSMSGPVEPYGPSVLHRGLRIWVIQDSAEVELKLATSALRTGSTWKIWGFSDD